MNTDMVFLVHKERKVNKLKLTYDQTINQLRHDLHDIYVSTLAHTLFKSESTWRADFLVQLLHDIEDSLNNDAEQIKGIIPNAIYQLLEMDGVTIEILYNSLNQPLQDGE